MSIDALRDQLPAYAKDLAMNLTTLAGETTLNDAQKWGCFIASAYAVGQPDVIKAINDQTADLPDAVKTGAKAAAAIMGMNNVYYRALHLMKNQEYAGMPAKLRMTIISNPGVDKMDFELWCTAVSAVNGCGICLDAHEEQLRRHQAEPITIQATLRIGAVVNAISRVLAAENAAGA
jgi:alkyl hydroperoxide reductase subunit D